MNQFDQKKRFSPTHLTATYVWGPNLSGTIGGAGGIGSLFWIMRFASSVSCFLIHNRNGNMMDLVSASDGSVVTQYEYDPFAKPLRATDTLATDNPFRFSTKYTDSETGLISYGYRYYSPTLQQWLSRDLLDEQYRLERDETNHNLYCCYARNQPF